MASRWHPAVAEYGLDLDHSFSTLGLERFRKTIAPPQVVPSDQELFITDVAIETAEDTIPVREYTPPNAIGTILWVHGGGFIAGGLSSHDNFARNLALSSRCRVALPEYDLAPERQFPVQVEQIAAAIHHYARSGGPTVCGGDSAGGAILVGALDLAAQAAPSDIPTAMILIYPMLDDRLTGASMVEFEGTVPLDLAAVKWFWDEYLGSATPTKRAAPGRSLRSLALPPRCLIILAEVDVLRSEGENAAAAWTDAGIQVQVHLVRGAIHGYMGIDSDLARSASSKTYELIAEFTRTQTDRSAAADQSAE